MTYTNAGTHGAKRQSWSLANPRGLLKSVIDRNPDADERKLFKKFCAALEDNDAEDFRATIYLSWFTNNYRSLRNGKQTRKQSPIDKREIAQMMALIKARAKRMVLLDMIMPNGKPLRDCSDAECRHMGGWLEAVASCLKAGERVGDVMTENDVRALFVELTGDVRR